MVDTAGIGSMLELHNLPPPLPYERTVNLSAFISILGLLHQLPFLMGTGHEAS